MSEPNTHVVALSGGVGGAKLALGLSQQLGPADLTVVCNTGDDFEHLGVTICPDLDTVLYTLADWNNKELGWGQAEESWQFLEALRRLGGEDWFSLGDRDMATHIVRTELLEAGQSLSSVTAHLATKMGITHRVLPMSDEPVRTQVLTQSGERLMFQHYFVRDRCEPAVTGFEFAGIENARPSSGFLEALQRAGSIIVCPSNPFVSVDPILRLPGVEQAIRAAEVPVIVVSNIVGGQALKGPAAKMMTELEIPMTALGVAQHYAGQYPGLFSGFVLDSEDESLQEAVEALGLPTIVTNTVMLTLHDKTELARECLAFADSLKLP